MCAWVWERKDCDSSSISGEQHPPPLPSPPPPASPPSGLQKRGLCLSRNLPLSRYHPRQTKRQPGERQRHGKKRRGRATERRGMSWGGRDGVNCGERFNPAGSDFPATPVFSFSASVVANGRRADVANTTPLTQTPAPSNFKSSKPVWSAS